MEWPNSPEMPYTQKDVASYIIDAHLSWQDCQGKLGALAISDK